MSIEIEREIKSKLSYWAKRKFTNQVYYISSLFLKNKIGYEEYVFKYNKILRKWKVIIGGENEIKRF